MSHPDQKVLLIGEAADIIDSVFDMLNDVELPDFRVATCFSIDEACAALKEREYSVVIVCPRGDAVAEVGRLAQLHRGRPLIVLLAVAEAVMLLALLRAGASDLFLIRELEAQRGAFVDSVAEALRHARLQQDNIRYREELESSLNELQTDQQAAHRVQQNMLPPETLELKGVCARYTLVPSLYLSGDFVDAVEINDRWVMFYLADVSGHGASSALVTVLLKNMTGRLVRNFRRGSSFDILSPEDTLKRFNLELLETNIGKHLSMFVGVIDLDKSRLSYAVGGLHPMPLLSAAGQTEYLEGRGMPLGLFTEPVFDARSVALPDDFQLTLFSDGVLEVLPQQGLEAKEGYLRSLVGEMKGAAPVDLCGVLLPEGLEAAPDDIAIMTIARQ